MAESPGVIEMGDNVTTRPQSSHIDKASQSEKPRRSSVRCYLRVFTYTDKKGWAMNIVAFVCMIAAGTLLPLMEIVFGQFVTVFNDFALGITSPAEYRAQVSRYALYFVYLFIGKFVLAYIWMFLVSMSALRTTKALRMKFLQQTLRQEVSYFDSAESSSIASSVSTNGNLVNQGISERLGVTIQALSTFFTAFIVAFAVQWKLTLITLAVAPTIIIVTLVCFGIDAGQDEQIFTIYGRAGKMAEEVFSSIRTVHAFWAFHGFSRRYEAILDEAKEVGMRKSPNFSVLFSIEYFCIFSGYGLAFWQGISMYSSGEITQPGKIITVIFAVIVAAQAINMIAPQLVQLAKAASAARELFEAIDRVSDIDSLSTEGLQPETCEGTLEFRDVTFAYPSRPDVDVLKALTLRIPANKTTAIVGASGSGKSTTIGLIERWFKRSSGTVKLDGHNIEDLNIQWLRTNVRLVQQEPVLFNATVYDNVIYGLAGTPMADLSAEEKEKIVREACRAAYAHDFIEELPKGYHTEVGQRGAMLSGGQKQRIAIARSIISNPRVLLLDEATSALDPKAEHIVQEALNNVAVGRTLLVIAHRLSTIRDADNIVVMSAGSIVEQGTHDELLRVGGAYSRLVRAQDLGEQQNKEVQGIHEKAEEVDGEPVAHIKSVVNAETGQVGVVEDGGAGIINYNLLKCLYIICGEQRTIWCEMLLFTVCCVLAAGTFPVLAILFSRVMVVFTLTGSEMTSQGDFWSLMFFVVALGNLVAYAIIGWVSNVVSQVIMKRYKLEVFDNILRQDMAFFDEPGNTSGALTSRLATQPQQLQELVSFNLGIIFIAVIAVLSCAVLAIATGWKLGLVIVFGALPAIVGSGWLRIRLEFRLDDATAARFADSAGIASEAALAIRTISSLALERQVLDKYNDSLKSIAKTSVRSLVWTMLWYALSQSISFLGMGLGFWYGGLLMSTGEYTSEQFYVVFIGIIFSGEMAASFFQFTTSITKGQAGANYIFQLRSRLEATEERRQGAHSEKEVKEGPAISCQDLEFAYPQRIQARVLRGISTEIKPGEFVAFVGPSGCGKTTMISLLERFYDPTSGAIRMDGQDNRALNLESYRSTISLVQQEPILYQGSIRENIALGVPTDGPDPDPGSGSGSGSEIPLSDEDIMSACRQANIDTFVASLPEGLSTPCGSQGLQLSGGQRQRITIARALARQPRLLLLDEATSSLDTESERIVQAALETAAKAENGEGEGGGTRTRTTVAVAHRLSTIKGADRICVFQGGRIVEEGTHEELLALRGMYYEMCLGQSLDRQV